MLNLFLPNKHVKSIFEITPEFLHSENKKGIIIDLDNTLVPWNVTKPTPKIIDWLQKMTDADIKVTIFSNNNQERVSVFCESIQTPFIYKAQKPLKRAFNRAKQDMKLSKDELVVIGDQLLTDILGGNRVGLYTILVVPIVQTDAPITKFNRNLERLILNHFYRKGKLTRREINE